ncbi:MAG: hypothetical protein QOF51_227 [Chloroflexota bacterium]|jgi:photosystem II stability/assembly factor-like uncharacterized protein|nr:hypothetical protein [Chloroflexota bacterium]
MGEIAVLAGSELALYVLRSRDDGRSWLEPEVAIPDLDVADVHCGADGAAYAGTRGHGILSSGDGLRSWVPIDTPPAMQKVRSLCLAGDQILAGTEARPAPAGVFAWEDGEEWRPLGDLATCSGSAEWRYPVAEVGVHVRHLARDPHRPERIYGAMQVGGIAISPDSGQSWYDRRNLDLDVHMVEADPRRPGVVYAGTGGGGMYRSRDWGESWEPISESCGQFVVQFALDPQDPDRMYLGTAAANYRSWYSDPHGARGEMWRSDDAGTSWRKLGGGLPEYLGGRVGALVVDPAQPQHVFFSCDVPRETADRGVYHSPDGGETWRRIAAIPQVVALATAQL